MCITLVIIHLLLRTEMGEVYKGRVPLCVGTKGIYKIFKMHSYFYIVCVKARPVQNISPGFKVFYHLQ